MKIALLAIALLYDYLWTQDWLFRVHAALHNVMLHSLQAGSPVIRFC